MLERILSAVRSCLSRFFGRVEWLDDRDDPGYVVRALDPADELEFRRRILQWVPSEDGGPCNCPECIRLRRWQADVADLTDWDGFHIPH